MAGRQPPARPPSSFLLKIINFFSCPPPPRNRPPIARWLFGLILVSIFLVFSATGVVLMWCTDLYLDSILNQMTLRNGTEVFDAWSKPPVKPLICGHVFNYTNMEAYTKGIDSKIKIKEVGPYCYRETQEKVNIVFNEDGTITYSDVRQHQFEPDHSKGSMNDTLVVPNMALIAVLGICQNLPFYQRVVVSSTLKRVLKYSDTMIKVRAHDYFFGYDDRLVEMATTIAKYLNHDIPFEKFGLLSQRASVTDDTITVLTGAKDLNTIGIVTEVNGDERLEVWSDYECNRIDGSDGAFFPRNEINETATLYLFHKDLCRRMPFVYDKEVDFQSGVMGMRFHAAPNVYDTNGTCYCPETGCAPSGVFDLSPCSKGVPIMMSFPHFLYADSSVREPFEGLHPDPEKHEFYIDIQRLLGFTLGTVSRLQLNIKVVKPKGFFMLKEFPKDIILPIVWLQVSAEELPPHLFNYIYHSSITVKRIQLALQWGTLILTFMLILAMAYIIRKRPKYKKEVECSQCTQEMLPVGSKISISRS